MNRLFCHASQRAAIRGPNARAVGFSLIELMIAILLGLLLADGIITVLNTTSATSRVQDALALLQENGRFAISRMTEDLRMGSYQYCSDSGGPGVAQAATYYALRDAARAPTVYAANLALPDLPTAPPPSPPGWLPANSPYPLSPSYFLQGYDCSTTTTACQPAVAATIAPVTGIRAGDRVVGTDVVTLRYLQSSGWSANSGGSLQTATATGNLASIKIVPAVTDAPLDAFVNGNLAMLADCTGSSIFRITRTGNVFSPNATSNFNATTYPVPAANANSDARLYDFSDDFFTVTYFLQLSADADASGGLVSSLMRDVNGSGAQEVVQGVERMDLRYGIEDANGATRFLTASQIQSSSLTNAIPCPPAPTGVQNPPATSAEQGCLWRAVKSVEVFLLLNSITDVANNAVDTTYRYSFDNSDKAAPARATMPASGLPSGRMLRREFRSLVALRNNNS